MTRALERAARRAGGRPIDPGEPPATPSPSGRELAVYRENAADLEAWVLRSRVVQVMQWAAVGFGCYWTWKYGFPGTLAAIIAAWLINRLKPEASERLDKFTRR